MKRCVPLVLLLACFVFAGCSESPPANMPPAAPTQTAVTEESQPAMPEPQPVTPEPSAQANGRRPSMPAEKATSVDAAPPSASPAPPAEPAAPSSGRALGNAVRRAFGIPIPAADPSEPLISESTGELVSPKPQPDSSKP